VRSIGRSEFLGVTWEIGVGSGADLAAGRRVDILLGDATR